MDVSYGIPMASAKNTSHGVSFKPPPLCPLLRRALGAMTAAGIGSVPTGLSILVAGAGFFLALMGWPVHADTFDFLSQDLCPVILFTLTTSLGHPFDPGMLRGTVSV